jgi:hypothetical protein
VAQTGLVGGAFPTHKTAMTAVPGPRALKDGEERVEHPLRVARPGRREAGQDLDAQARRLRHAVKHDIVNTGSTAVSPQLYLQLVRDGNKPPGESSFYSTFTGPAVYTEAKKYQKIEFKDIETARSTFPKTATNGYVAMVQHYFASAWLLADGITRELFVRKVDTNLYSVGMITSLGTIEPGHQDHRRAPVRRPAGRDHDGKAVPRPGTGQGLRLADHPVQAAVLAARQAAQAAGQLGLVHRGPGAAAQDRVLLAQCQGLRQHGQDEGHQPQDHGDARAPEGQAAADAAGDDAHLPRGKGQPHGWLLPHHDPDPRVHCAVLGAAVQRGNAQCALDWLDPRPVGPTHSSSCRC